MTTLDRDAVIRKLYTDHGPAVTAFLLRYTNGDHPWAEDILQETMLRAWSHSEELDLTPPLVRSWLYTVASRIAIDSIRRRQVRPSEIGLPPVDPAERADAMDQALTSIVLRAAIQQLSLAHQAVVVELYLRDSSVRDTAELLGIPEGTVKSRAFHALHTLRGKLAEPRRTSRRQRPVSAAA